MQMNCLTAMGKEWLFWIRAMAYESLNWQVLLYFKKNRDHIYGKATCLTFKTDMPNISGIKILVRCNEWPYDAWKLSITLCSFPSPFFFLFYSFFFLAWDHLETNGFDLISKTTYEACFC